MSLYNSVRLDSVLHKGTGGSVPKNGAKTLLLASMLKKRVQRLRLALSKRPTSVLAPAPIPLQVFICERKKGASFRNAVSYSSFPGSSKTDRNQIILNSETSDSAKGGGTSSTAERIIEGLADIRQSTTFSAFYNRQYRVSFVTVR